MTTHELVKKYKSRYQLNVNVSVSGGYRKTQYTAMALMYIGGEKSPDEERFMMYLIDTGAVSMGDFVSSYETNPYFSDGNVRMEKMFIMYLLYVGEIEQNQIEDFRKSMLSYLDSRRPSSIFAAIIGIVILVTAIIGFATM